jgi:hypothetical protein
LPKCGETLRTLKEDLIRLGRVNITDEDMNMMDGGNTAELDRVEKPHPLFLLPSRWWKEFR